MKVVFAVFVLCQALAAAGELAIAWDSSPDASVTGYAIYVGAAPGSYQQRIDVGAHTNATLTNLACGARCYVVVKACNASSLESLPSNEVSYLIPGAFRLSGSCISGIGLNLVGEAGKTYQLQASTNLVEWATIQVVQPVSNSWVNWVDPESVAISRRFYRIVVGP